MSKCIKCGRELTSAEIPEFYNGMCEKCYKEQNCAEYPFKQGINNYQNQIDQFKQQLAEKQNTINEINKEFVQAVHDWKTLCAEKDKEIERLNTIIGLSQLQVSEKDIQKFQQLANQSAVNINYIAIQELEKVKVNLKDRISMMKNEEHSYLQKVVAWYDICDQINKQIKELKGE